MNQYCYETKRLVLCDIEAGGSMRSTAKKYNVSLTSVANWCKENNVRSKFRKAKSRSDKELTAYIRKMGIVSVIDFRKKFGYDHARALIRLRRLEAKGLIKHEVAHKRYYSAV